MSSPSSLKPVICYTAGTPNGQKVHIMIEELKEAYKSKTGFDAEYKILSFNKNEQKSEWFLKINPNGRIPALVDPNQNPEFNVFETAAILLWLEKEYDPDHLFSFGNNEENGEKYRSEALQWIFFIHGGIGPMQGQLNHFGHYAAEDLPYAKDRYRNECRRLYSVIETGLQGRDWLVGTEKGKYSIADMNAFPWMWTGQYSGIPYEALGPNTKAWMQRNWDRSAVKTAMAIPTPKDWHPDAISPDFQKKHGENIKDSSAENKSWVLKGMEDDKK